MFASFATPFGGSPLDRCDLFQEIPARMIFFLGASESFTRWNIFLAGRYQRAVNLR
jgi:hypothetical protein